MGIDKFFESLADDLDLKDEPYRSDFLKNANSFKKKFVTNTIQLLEFSENSWKQFDLPEQIILPVKRKLQYGKNWEDKVKEIYS